MKPKTIRDFLLMIEDEKIRTEAIENADKGIIDTEELEFSLATAIMSSFKWANSPQGAPYWNKIHEQAKNNTLKTREI